MKCGLMNNLKFKLLFSFLLLGCAKSNDFEEVKYMIAGKEYKLWDMQNEKHPDRKPSSGFYINQNGEAIKFDYRDGFSREEHNDGDVAHSNDWKLLSIDSIEFWGSKCKIEKITNDTFVISNIAERTILIQSKNQTDFEH